MTDPLSRALNALQYLYAPRTDPVSVAFWEEVRDALLDAQREQAAFVEVVRTGRALIEAIDRYDAAPEDNMTRTANLAEAAEDAFVEALNRCPADLDAEAQPWGEEAFLVALDHIADEGEDGDEEPRR